MKDVESLTKTSITQTVLKKSLNCRSTLCSSMYEYLLPVEEPEVLSTITKLKPKQSTDIHGLSVFHYQEIANASVKPLKVFVNNSFDKIIFPDALKLSKIVPICKKGNTSLTTNTIDTQCLYCLL